MTWLWDLLRNLTINFCMYLYLLTCFMTGLEKVLISPWLVTLLHICGVTPTPQSPISPKLCTDITENSTLALMLPCRALMSPLRVASSDVSASSADIVASNRECFMLWWKINSFLPEISVCWNCTEKITIKIERAFSVILSASPATRRSFQLSPHHPTVPQKTSDLIRNWQLQMQDGIFQATPLLTVSAICCVCWHKHLLIEVATMACRLGVKVYCNRCCNRSVGESTWRQH